MDCFFVLSGFLITGILLDTTDQPHRARNFYLRRTLRIFPLYYAVFLLVLLAEPLAHWQWDARWLLWPAYLANLLGIVHRGPVDQPTQDVIFGILRTRSGARIFLGHFWSLCVEEQFYLFWPWIVYYIRNRRTLLFLCLSILVACLGLRILALTSFPTRWLEMFVPIRSTPFRIDSIIFGATAALLYRGPHRERLLRYARPVAWSAALLFLAALHPPPHLMATNWGNIFIQTIGFSLVALLSAGVILRLLTPASRLYRPFCARPLRWLGRVSYGAYVFHDIPHVFYNRLAHTHRSGTTLIALPCTLLLAALSYRYLERPFLELKTRVSS